MEIVTSPTSIFPLRYPQSDPSLPNCGAKAVPINITMGADDWTVNLTILRQQKDFGSLRCIWIDTLDMTDPIIVYVDGSIQRFRVMPGTTGYYPVIVVNDPIVRFVLDSYTSGANVLRVVFLNFVPETNANAEAIKVSNFPIVQPISGNVGILTNPLTISSSVYLSQIPHIFTGTVGSTALRMISINLFEVQTPQNGVSISDGSGFAIFGVSVGPLTNAFTQGSFFYSDSLDLQMNNATSGLSVKLLGALTSGSISIVIGY